MSDFPRRKQPECCDCCGFKAPTKEYTNNSTMYRTDVTEESKWMWLCELCSHSPCGYRVVANPHSISTLDVASTILYGVNMILAKLSEAK